MTKIETKYSSTVHDKHINTDSMAESDTRYTLAKNYSLDLPRYASVEFPLNVVNDEKAVELIGGPEDVRRSLVDKNVPLELRLRPDDPYLHPIHSEVSTSENLLVKIRLPKGELSKYNGDLQLAIRANKESYQFEPIAVLNKNFRFREIADFQMNVARNELLQLTTDTFYGNDFHKLKQYRQLLAERDLYDTSGKLDLPPFLSFSKIKVPFSYNFTNNKGTLVKSEDGTMRLVNTKQPVKVNTTFVPWDAPAPVRPSPDLIRYVEEARKNVQEQLSDNQIAASVIKNSASFQLVECIRLLELKFDEKPIWLRRHLYSIIPINWRNSFRYALAYVSYSTRMGPWKQSYIKFGVDPKSSDIYALYQTERFRVHTASKRNDYDDVDEDDDNQGDDLVTDPLLVDKSSVRELPSDFKFNGRNIPTISSFQLCDIEDPQLMELISPENLVSELSERDGWYNPVSLCRLRLIMKYKLRSLVSRDPISDIKLKQVGDAAVSRYQNNIEQKRQDKPGEESDDSDEDEDDDDDDNGQDHELETDLITRFEKSHPEVYQSLKGVLRQEDVMQI